MKKLAIAVLVVFFAVSQGTAHADMVKGNVASIDNAAKSLTINRVNATTGAEEQVAISVTDTTAFSGTASLEELKAGDEVWVDATEDPATKNWVASSVKLSLLQPASETPAAQTPSATQ
ncbi:MAG: hypothetical protein A3C35_05560 [Omnitrophica bacterium RIFCSPHIGHO2_02_FULL_46_11]|nr:MAG: hypothetical protein A3C35_05560 [Omnitrophica bacterium RIFCSPHIGHO2_02_FULL_46_11]OGW87993.1 MAG: hypothetical protein A3A81_08350 [Omnitrophica bacterium RIFCSPLOWO2_01_FULL_45_10b]